MQQQMTTTTKVSGVYYMSLPKPPHGSTKLILDVDDNDEARAEEVEGGRGNDGRVEFKKCSRSPSHNSGKEGVDFCFEA